MKTWRIPEIREDMPRMQLRLKGDRQVEQDDEVLSETHIVDHRLMRCGYVGPSRCTPDRVDH